MASWCPPLQRARHPVRDRADRRQRQGGVLRLGQRVVSDRDARLLAQRLSEVEQRLALDAVELPGADENTRALCEATRARVADDLELVSAALERSHQLAY
jgi:hypothetical protein